MRRRAQTFAQLVLLSVAAAAASLAGASCESAAPAHPPMRSQRCAACHMQDYLDVTHPVHVKLKPTTCAVCHTQTAWHPHVLNHPWHLTGAHTRGHCFYCHEGSPPVFEGTPKTCIGCHQDDYDHAGFPGHSRFPTTCADCHDTVTWATATYDVGQTPEEDTRWDSGIPPGEEGAPDAGAWQEDAGTDGGTRRRRRTTRTTSNTTPDTTTTPPDVVTSPSRRR